MEKAPRSLSACVKNWSSNIRPNTPNGSIHSAMRANNYVPHPTPKKTEENKAILHCLASREMLLRFVRAQERQSAARNSENRAPGKVYLVGAGPGDPELLTVRAARLLAAADIVLHDSLVSAEILSMISPCAEIVDVGKRAGRKLLTQDEINSLLVSYAESKPPSCASKAAILHCSAAPVKSWKRCAARIFHMKWFPASARQWVPQPRRGYR